MIPFFIQKLFFYTWWKGKMKMDECVFCKLTTREMPADIFYEDDTCMVFEDINPQALIHLLVVPKKHIASLNEVEASEDRDMLGHLICVAAHIAKEKAIDESGYRTVINTNADAGQAVFHLHVHVLGGRRLGWPPG